MKAHVKKKSNAAISFSASAPEMAAEKIFLSENEVR